MSEKRQSSTLEVLFGALVLIAVAVVALDWLGVDALDGWAGTAGLAVLVFGLLALMAEGIATGVLRGRGGRVERARHPTHFWFMFVIYGLLAAALTVATLLLHPGL